MDDREADKLDFAASLTTASAEREIKRLSALAAKLDISNISGECLWCGEHTGYSKRWCDTECRDEYESA